MKKIAVIAFAGLGVLGVPAHGQTTQEQYSQACAETAGRTDQATIEWRARYCAAPQLADAPVVTYDQPRARGNGGFSAGVTAGTLGIGPEVAYRFSETFGIRANATFFNLGREVESDGVTYDGDLKLRSFGAMLDIHPFGGGFRVSAGARTGRNKVLLAATPTEAVEIGDETYTPAEIGVLSGEVSAKKFAPTVTIGWGGGLTPGLKFGAELGAMFHGSPRVRNLEASGTLANNSEFQASLLEERREIEDDIDNFKIYPILQFSLGYRF